jgi:hypothetical protein
MKTLISFFFCCFLSLAVNARLIPYNKAGLWGIVDNNREWIIPAVYNEVKFCGTEARYILAQKGDTLTIFDTLGRSIRKLGSKYDTLHRQIGLASICDNISFLTINGRPGAIIKHPGTKELIAYNGEVLIPAGQYEEIRYSDYLRGIIIQKGRLSGMLDTTLREIIPLKEYERTGVFQDFVLTQEPGSSAKIISRKTGRVLDCKVPLKLANEYRYGNAQLNYFAYEHNGLTGVKDSMCNTIVPPSYKDAR